MFTAGTIGILTHGHVERASMRGAKGAMDPGEGAKGAVPWAMIWRLSLGTLSRCACFLSARNIYRVSSESSVNASEAGSSHLIAWLNG